MWTQADENVGGVLGLLTPLDSSTVQHVDK